MVRGIGNDIIEISRIRSSISRHGKHFLDKVFTEAEQSYCARYRDSVPHFAGRFAAKEAVIKAIGKGFKIDFTWLDIEISNDDHGKPLVSFSDRLTLQLQNPQMLVSISHCREYATAFALLF